MKLKLNSLVCALGLTATLAGRSWAEGPYPPTDWPTNIDATKKVHYMAVDNVFFAPNTNWNQTLSICALNAGADQGTVLAPCIQGYNAIKAAYFYFNIADTAYSEWTNTPQLDILMAVYGDAGVLNPTNSALARRVRFQEGTSASGYSTYTTPTQFLFPTNAFNGQWNWILFTITNNMWSNAVDGKLYRQVGTIKPGSSPTSAVNGGINSGTIRMQCPDNQGGTIQGMMGWTIHAVAIGEAGAFSTTNDVNIFFAPDTNAVQCPSAPPANLVGMDFNAGTSNYMVVLDQGDSTVMYTNGVGPAGDLRNAVVPTAFNGFSALLNFGVESNYLGYPCQPNEAWKVCIDYYDDPSFSSNYPPVQIGPEAYATDGQGCAGPAIYPTTGLATLQGTGQWIRRSWVVGGATGVNLMGVNASPLTAGPRLICMSQPVAVSRVDMGILRAAGPLAGQDPLAGCAQDPLVCQGVYSNYVELDLANGITNGLDVGTSSGDQYMVLENSGPANDQRFSIRPSFGDIGNGVYLQFQIVSNMLGSTYQDNAHLAIVVTYYDDPALVGKRFGIDAWRYQLLSQNPIFAADNSKWIALQGTGKWRDAYWEIDRIQFSGVNQAPQAAARLKCEERIHVSRVRYSVIRTCGPGAGQNLLDSYRVKSFTAGPDTNGLMRLSWPYQEPQLTIQGASSLPASWSTFMGTPIPAEGEQAVVRLAPTNDVQFFRLFRPAIP